MKNYEKFVNEKVDDILDYDEIENQSIEDDSIEDRTIKPETIRTIQDLTMKKGEHDLDTYDLEVPETEEVTGEVVTDTEPTEPKRSEMDDYFAGYKKDQDNPIDYSRIKSEEEYDRLESDYWNKSKNVPQINLSLELEYKFRTLHEGDLPTRTQFLEEFGFDFDSITQDKWVEIVEDSQEYNYMSDRDFMKVYKKYKKLYNI